MRPLKIRQSYKVAFSPDGSKLLSLGRDVNLWSIGDRKKQWRTHPFSHPSRGAFSPDGASIAVKNTAGRIVALNTVSGETEHDFMNQSEGEGSNVLFSPSGDQLIDGSWDGLLTVRSRISGEICFQTQFHGEMVRRVHQPKNGRFFLSEHQPKATTSDKPPADCYFLRWSWPIGGAEPERFSFASPFVCSSAISHSGRYLVVVYGAPPDRMAMLELDGGAIRWIQEVETGGTGGSVRWSPCDRFVGAAQRDRIAIYCSEDGALIGRRLIQYPCSVDFSPNTSLVAFGSWQEGFIEDFPGDPST